MRARTWVSFVIIALLPSLALAQFGGGVGGMGGRGGRGGMGGAGGGRRGGDMGGGRGGYNREPPRFPEAKDLQNYNPAALLIDKRKKLALSDSQVAALKELESRIYERNAPLLVRYDSVRRDIRPPRDSAPAPRSPAADSARSAAMGQLRLVRSLLDSLQERRRADVLETLGLIADDRTKREAAKFIDEQDKQFEKQLPQMGFEGRGAAGRPRSGA